MAEQHSRRTVLKAVTLGAAAAGVAAAAAPGAVVAAPRERDDGPAHEGALVVYVRDHLTGELAVMSGEHEVIHHDRALATRLARLAARGA